MAYTTRSGTDIVERVTVLNGSEMDVEIESGVAGTPKIQVLIADIPRLIPHCPNHTGELVERQPHSSVCIDRFE